jgi:hypothetical protein
MGVIKLCKRAAPVMFNSKNIRAADAKVVGVGNPAEETYCYPNDANIPKSKCVVNTLFSTIV